MADRSAVPDSGVTESFAIARGVATERRIGPYKTICELGHGGMGSVYLAVRADEHFHKRVALKIIKGGIDTDELVRRFRRERQILASLDHPNIAKLLDGGATEDALPYLVMEYIEGQPITHYCDAHSLPLEARLKLFLGVCSAVQYAHRNLIVHRDIKPSNILVTPDGTPRLLDFGIAKLLNPDLSRDEPTATGSVLTPEYASPEQARGDPITTSTDVYSLGVLLYELLTGRHPYRTKGRQALEILRAVVEQEPEKPSTAVEGPDETSPEAVAGTTGHAVPRTRDGGGQKLRRRLRGDLDNIVLMALRKEPPKRYGSVEALAEDIRRYLDGRPVLARKDTLGYRARKFLRRNAAAAVGLAAFVLLVIGFGAVMGVQSARLARERDRAARERDKAENVAAFLVSLFKVSNPSEARSNTITAREVLDRGADRIDKELANEPEVRASLMGTIGSVYNNLGLYDKSIGLQSEALRLRESIHGTEHPDVAQSLHALGTALAGRGDFAGAEAASRRSLAIRRKLLGSDHIDMANSLHNLAAMLLKKGDYTGGEELLNEAIAIKRKRLGPESAEVAFSLNNLAGLRFKRGDYGGAEAVMRDVLAINEKRLGHEHVEVAKSMQNLAVVLTYRGDYDGAEAAHREALAIHRKILGGDHPQVSHNLMTLAIVVEQKGQYPEAELLYREALALQRKTLGQEHPDIATTLGGLAATLSKEGDQAGAEAHYRQALAMQRRFLGDEHPEVAVTMKGLADVLRAMHQRDEAERLYRRALAIQRQKLPPKHPDIASSLIGYGVLAGGESARLSESESLLREGLQIRREALPTGHPDTAEAESLLGGCLVQLHRFEEAEPLLLASHAILRSRRGGRDPQSQDALRRIIELYRALGRPERATAYRAQLVASETTSSP